MRGVQQSAGGQGTGNCYAACVASILELQVADVPDLVESGEEWFSVLERWLEPMNLAPIMVVSHDSPTKGLSVVGGDFPEGTHCMVALSNAVIWNPTMEPVPFGFVPRDWTILVPLDPLQPVRVRRQGRSSTRPLILMSRKLEAIDRPTSSIE